MPPFIPTTFSALLDARAALADETAVTATTLPTGEWGLRDGVLRPERGDYFSVIAVRDDDGIESILLQQRETAIAGLAMCRVDGVRYFLLNARCEPGLHRACQFSTTVQSTPSNYERKHGGAATAHLDLFLDSGPQVEVVHDSLEFDWGSYYEAKTKRFLLVELAEPVAAANPFHWVSESDLHQLLETDFAVTGDLRAAVALLWARDRGAKPSASDQQESRALHPVGLDELRDWVVDDEGIRERAPRQSVSVEFVHTRSSSREVREWSQPLLRVAAPDRVRLAVDERGRVALSRGTQVGLGGRELWMPGRPSASLTPITTVRTSAEGGRFMQHEVVLQLTSAAEPSDDVTWATVDQLATLLLTPQTTSIELRLAATLLREKGE